MLFIISSQILQNLAWNNEQHCKVTCIYLLQVMGEFEKMEYYREQMRQAGWKPDTLHYCNLIYALGKHEKTKEVIKVYLYSAFILAYTNRFNEMRDNGYQIIRSPSTWLLSNSFYSISNVLTVLRINKLRVSCNESQQHGGWCIAYISENKGS